MLPRSVCVLSAVMAAGMAGGEKLRELLKTRKFPINVFTERDEISFKKNSDF